jgi:hypothetical protein
MFTSYKHTKVYIYIYTHAYTYIHTYIRNTFMTSLPPRRLKKSSMQKTKKKGEEITPRIDIHVIKAM